MSDSQNTKGIFQKKIQDYQVTQNWDEEESNQALDLTKNEQWRFGAFSNCCFAE